MPDFSELSDDELLRLAIAEAFDKGGRADFALGQLYAATVAGDPNRERIWLEETAPDQAELDIHLDGGNVVGHSTKAKDFTEFVKAVSGTTKEIAKADAGRGRVTEDILITAPTQGSVRFVLSAPAPPAHNDPGKPTLESTEASTVVSDALREVATMLQLATADGDDSPLYSLVSDLSPKARAELRKLTEVTRRAGWTITGTVRQRRFGLDEIHFDPTGADRLASELDAQTTSQRAETLTGQLDGFRRSLGTVYLLPVGRSPLPLAVTNRDLLAKVAEIAADVDAVVEARINVVESTVGKSSTTLRTSRTLTDITLLERGGVQTTIED